VADIDYRPDRKGIGRLLVSQDMHRLVARAAAEGMRYAQSISPDAEPYGEGYIASFRVDTGGTVKVAGSTRAVARLVNTSDHASLVEYANGSRVLGRTVDYIEAWAP
jgi:hypothetical protein